VTDYGSQLAAIERLRQLGAVRILIDDSRIEVMFDALAQPQQAAEMSTEEREQRWQQQYVTDALKSSEP
jgi:hypothetical protein